MLPFAAMTYENIKLIIEKTFGDPAASASDNVPSVHWNLFFFLGEYEKTIPTRDWCCYERWQGFWKFKSIKDSDSSDKKLI